ncbi:hypothetical protein BRADI_5g01686v3 [Brachypodium distachyon]|uniref:Uncharacterized protein n=1 Tax=Brachypodium distachyon TaxID=15368 RepID=A0A0Q3E5W1_BRADI|nr:hypothetical protein BRADI_5g01686v3 [Brachypodium distachyon]
MERGRRTKEEGDLIKQRRCSDGMKRRIFFVSRETTTRGEKACVTCYLGTTHDRHRRWSILLLPIVCDAKGISNNTHKQVLVVCHASNLMTWTKKSRKCDEMVTSVRNDTSTSTNALVPTENAIGGLLAAT